MPRHLWKQAHGVWQQWYSAARADIHPRCTYRHVGSASDSAYTHATSKSRTERPRQWECTLAAVVPLSCCLAAALGTELMRVRTKDPLVGFPTFARDLRSSSPVASLFWKTLSNNQMLDGLDIQASRIWSDLTRAAGTGKRDPSGSHCLVYLPFCVSLPSPDHPSKKQLSFGSLVSSAVLREIRLVRPDLQG